MPRLASADRLLIARRLHNQRLTASTFDDPVQVVAWQGAVQAQEYAVARWALGLRCRETSDAAVERAFDDGRILRTHVMRPTWHFVAPADIRWLEALTAPRVEAAMASRRRKLELTPKLFARSHRIVGRALEGGRFLTRAELAAALARRGIVASGERLGHLMLQAELDRVICSGPRRGKQFTYALLDERAPRAGTMDREAALAELTRRYFSSHGPATARDFSWWSNLTMKDVRLGLELCQAALVRETIGRLTYWSSPAVQAPDPGDATYLLPIYDEYLIAYRDREVVTGPHAADAGAAFLAGFPHHLIVGGRLAGSWARTAGRDGLAVTIAPFRRLTAAETRQVRRAVDCFGVFNAASIQPTFVSPKRR